MRWLRYLALLTVLVVLVAVVSGIWVWRRAIPVVDGTVKAPGLGTPTEIVRDRFGIPHIFAATDADAYYALGWAMAQDRLFQMDVVRRVAQGRLAELLGPGAVTVDTLFRTMDLPGIGQRAFAHTRPEVRAALEAFTRGANASVAWQGYRLPPEYTLLRTTPAPFRADDFVGVVGFMTWGLNPAWNFDPIYQRIAAKVGPRRAGELFPQAALGPPSTAWQGAPPQPDALRLSATGRALLETLPSLRASNSWVLGPGHSDTHHALLANDPHLGHGLPSTWYLAHLHTPTQDVLGVFIPGVPFAIIGHNRRIAWGLVNAMLDAGDFFLERLSAEHPGKVLMGKDWVPLTERKETIAVKGGEAVPLVVRSTPHGPLVGHFKPDAQQALSYRWVYAAAQDANDINAFYDLNRARDWKTFRAAVRQLGAVSQTATYADVDGHIGMQYTGRIPLRAGRPDGLAYRMGWTGRDEWKGFLPFERNPSVFDPPEGFIAVANNPPPQVGEVYLSGTYEPEDRITRIRERLARKPHFSLEELGQIQNDVLFATGRALAPQVVAAFADAPPREPALRAAVEALRGWDGTMGEASTGATVFAVFYKHLFREIFADELGDKLLDDLRARDNQSAVMMHVVLSRHLERWFDRQDTPQVEDRAAIFRAALGKAAAELRKRMGDDPAQWRWGRLHQITFHHPLGRVKALAPLFNEGPFPLPGHAQTVNKGQFHDNDFQVYQGPSMRQLTDLGDPAHALGVLPTGQSGVPASPHYADLIPLWREGRYAPLLMERADIERIREGRLLLEP